MFDFQMSMEENFASFRDQESGDYVFVDSFDNVEFNVSYGSPADHKPIGVIWADSDDVLNERLRELVRMKIDTKKHDH